MVNRYSLADYKVSISFPAGLKAGLSTDPLEIGGPGNNGEDGSFVGTIKLARATNTWETEADPTGSWVHNKNLDRHGTVTLSIRQISDDIIRLIMIARAIENDQTLKKGCKIDVYGADTQLVATAEDCYIVKIPEQNYGEKAQTQEWEWTSGRIKFNQEIK